MVKKEKNDLFRYLGLSLRLQTTSMALLTTIKTLFSKLKLYCLLIFLLLASRVLLADSITTATPVKDTRLELRDFDEQKIEAYKKSRDFMYDREPPGKTPWERFLQWLMRHLDDWLSDSKAGYVFDNYVKYVLIAVVVLVVVKLLLKADITALFFRRARAKKMLGHEVLDENIHEMDFDGLIEKTITERDYRKAVRLYYLKTLKQLTDKGLLDWQINKTNYDYQLELSNTAHFQPFRELSLLFDYVWYGEMPIDKEQFGGIQNNFVQFQRKL